MQILRPSPYPLPEGEGRVFRDFNSLSLKNELQRELHDARIAVGQTAGSTDVALDLAERPATIQSHHGSTRIQMIRKVEGCGSQLKRLSFPKREHSRKRQIQL